jgi:hypothetical protein
MYGGVALPLNLENAKGLETFVLGTNNRSLMEIFVITLRLVMIWMNPSINVRDEGHN